MKLKMVIEVCTNCDKSRSKALEIVVGHKGVVSAALGEKDKNKLEVIGEERVDPVKLTRSLRKKLGKWPHFLICIMPENAMSYAKLISVSNVEEKKKEDEKDEKEDENPKILYTNGTSSIPVYMCYRDPDPYYCSIM